LLSESTGKSKSQLKGQRQRQEHQQTNNSSLFLDRKIDEVTAGLRRGYSRLLYNISDENAQFILDYILVMKTEVNLSHSYRKDLLNLLTMFSKYTNNKSFQTDDQRKYFGIPRQFSQT
jgi:hypothetical protein